MDIVGIGYLGFEAREPAAWRKFGVEALGMMEWSGETGAPDAVYLKLDDRRYRMAFEKSDDDRIAYIGWEIKGRRGFEAAVAKLEQSTVPCELADDALCKRRGVVQMASFKDPAGFRHEVFFGQKWGLNSFVAPGLGRGFDCGDNGDQGIGHVVLAVPRYDSEIETFLRDILGFDWYGYGGGPSLGFWRSKLSKRSHVIAYLQTPGQQGVQHMGLFARTLDDVGAAYDVVLKQDIQLQQTLGRHTQDPVVSFYVMSPGGFAIEYCWEMVRFGQLPFETSPESISLWGHKLVGPMLGPSVRPVQSDATAVIGVKRSA